MTDILSPSEDRYAHLRTYAAEQKHTTIQRLKQAIEVLEAEERPVTMFSIKEVSGLDYMTYYRNREAFQLFQQHSTHLCKEREKEQAKLHQSKRKTAKGQKVLHEVKVKPRDPLLDYKRPRLVELLYEARAERDRVIQQAQAERDEIEQHYHKLLQEHMHCGVTIAKLEAQTAEYLTFIDHFRLAVRQEEHGPQH